MFHLINSNGKGTNFDSAVMKKYIYAVVLPTNDFNTCLTCSLGQVMMIQILTKFPCYLMPHKLNIHNLGLGLSCTVLNKLDVF